MTGDTLEEGQELAPEPPAAKAKNVTTTDVAVTSYVVLTLHGDTWQNRGSVAARSAEQAVRNYAAGASISEPTTVVAVPERSFKPVTVTAKVTTSLVIEEAS